MRTKVWSHLVIIDIQHIYLGSYKILHNLVPRLKRDMETKDIV